MKYIFLLLLAFLTFSPAQADAVWFSSSWNYKVKVEVNPNKVGTTTAITSFPVYVDLAGMPASFWTNASNTGADIRVLESDETTETAFELVSYNNSTKIGELHFMADSLATTSTSTFYIYYGNATATAYAVTDTYGRNNVWGDYVAVYHLEGNSTDRKGSYNGTDTSITYSSGLIGQGAGYNATTDRISLGTNTAFQFGEADQFTIQAWVSASTRNYGRTIFSRQDGAGAAGYRGYTFYTKDTSGGIQMDMYSNLGGGGNNVRTWASTIAADNTFYLLHFVSAGTSVASGMDLYRNASLQTASTPSNTLTGSTVISRNAQIGNRDGSNLGWQGLLDEVRVRASQLSTSWITTEYNNQNSTSTFFYIGAEEAYSAGTSTVASTTDSIIWFE